MFFSWSETIRVDPTRADGPSWSGPTFVPAYVIPEMTSEANSSHSPLFLGREHGKGQIYKLWKFMQN